MLRKVGIVVEVYNGMPAVSLDPNSWRKSSFSGAVGNCVEIAPLPDGRVAVRNSRDPDGPGLVQPKLGLVALIASIEVGSAG